MTLTDRLHAHPLTARLRQWRFLKFGIVGATGTGVNLGVLYLAQEHLFRSVMAPAMRLNLALALAIFVATINNFLWNRLWTWRDRQAGLKTSLLFQFIQYAVACWLSIALQVLATNLFAARMNYLFANLIAIVGVSVINYLVNDRWTFRARGKPT